MEITNAAFAHLITPVCPHEGTLARLMGEAILAFFGATLSHEDDPERTIRAVPEIQTCILKYAAKPARERGIRDFIVRMGINTGPVVVGEVGSDLRVEYTAMRYAINLAAREEQNAPAGGLLITHDTYRPVSENSDVQPQPPLSVRCHTELVQTTSYCTPGCAPSARLPALSRVSRFV
jgi:class 3 adenylate cyclase